MSASSECESSCSDVISDELSGVIQVQDFGHLGRSAAGSVAVSVQAYWLKIVLTEVPSVRHCVATPLSVLADGQSSR